MAGVDLRRLAKIAILGMACLLLQQVSVPYELSIGDAYDPAASLVHLHVGLLLAIAMLERDRWVLGGCFIVVTIGWIFRAQAYSYLAEQYVWGVAVAVGTYLWTRVCAAWMGWPRPVDTMRVEPADLARAYVIGLVLYPLGIVAMAAFSTPGLSLSAQINMGLQVLFAKHFGVAIITFPMVVAWTEWRRPHFLRMRAGWYGLPLIFLLSIVSTWVSYVNGGWLFDAVDRVVLMDYRFALFAMMGWAMLHLRARNSMLLLSATMFVLVYSLAATAEYMGTTVGFFNLVHLSVELAVLSAVLLYLLLMYRDSCDLSEKLVDETRRDAVTGLPNLNALLHRVVESRPEHREIGYLLLDQSDAMIEGVGLGAQTLIMNAVALRVSDLVEPYSIGTGQFALLAKSGDRPDDVWDRLVTRIEQAEIEIGQRPFRLLPYLGVAYCTFDGRESIDRAILKASHLSYEAKRHNEVKPLYDDGDDSSRQEHLQWIHDTAEALSCLREERIVLYFQEIRRVRDDAGTDDGDTICGEVLCRLCKEDGSLLPPMRFLRPIEAVGRGTELDLAVLRAVIAWFRDHPEAIKRCGKIAVNLTGQSLASATFRTRMRALLDASPLPLSRFCFEVTENCAVTNIAVASALLTELRALGCQIAIDDFGVGMQSFERLRDMPVDIIKIDGSFVRNIARRGRDYAVVQASVAVARAFGAETVAEFVEDEEILACLRELGVDWMQGYLVSKPLPIEEVFGKPV